MIKAIIFDFDGIIGSSEQARFAFLKQLLSSKGLVLKDEEFKNIVGRTTDTFFNTVEIEGLTPALKEEILAEFTQNYKGNIIQYVKPISVVVDFIKSYTGPLRFAVASGSGMKGLQTL